ncbi:mitochondria-eating -like [Schistosoma japonicum]|nr:mitochondria-eating -like [Schistosoma japonicum]
MEFIQPCIENKCTQKRPRAMVDSGNIMGSSVTDFSSKPQVNAPRCFNDCTDHGQESDNYFIPNDDPVKFVSKTNIFGFQDGDSITHLTDVLQSWLSPLVGRYNDLFTNLRVSCMRRLESFGQSDCARNQRLIFHAIQAGFTVTSHVIRRLPVSMQKENYFSRNIGERQLSILNTSLTTDQIEKLVAATFRRLSRHPPPECACHATITAISGTSIKRPISIRQPVTSQELSALDNLLREVCSLAWHLLAERHDSQLGIESDGTPSVWYADVDKTAKPGDTYNDKCYRRSYDSDPSAGQVHHYIWPCLILYTKKPIDIQQQHQSTNMGINRKYKIVKSCVLVKGEACTRNPIHAASQKDKAAALLNHEFSCNGVCRSVSPQIYNRSRSTSVRRV